MLQQKILPFCLLHALLYNYLHVLDHGIQLFRDVSVRGGERVGVVAPQNFLPDFLQTRVCSMIRNDDDAIDNFSPIILQPFHSLERNNCAKTSSQKHSKDTPTKLEFSGTF